MSEEDPAPEGADNTEHDPSVEEQFAAADAHADPGAEAAPSVEDIASSMGWQPKDKFRGDEATWKPAHEYLSASKDINRSLSRELREVRTTLETVSKTSAQIMADRLAEQRAELSQKYQDAVDRGDADGAWKAAGAIQNVDQQAASLTRPQEAPEEAIAWGQKNARVMGDPLAAQRAVQLCEPYARANYPAGKQLEAIEPILRREFPHLFEAPAKAPPGVSQPGTRATSSGRGGNTAADLPREARAIAADMVERGLIKSEDDYARNYFAVQRKGR